MNANGATTVMPGSLDARSLRPDLRKAMSDTEPIEKVKAISVPVTPMIACQLGRGSRNRIPTKKFRSSARRGTPEPRCTFASHAGKKRFFASPNTLRALDAVNTMPDPEGETIESAIRTQ